MLGKIESTHDSGHRILLGSARFNQALYFRLRVSNFLQHLASVLPQFGCDLDVSGTPEGQIMIQDMVRKFGYARQSTIDADPLRMAWKEGGRTVMVHIGRMIDVDAQALDAQTAARGEQ